MTMELKSIKFIAKLSEETLCYTARVHLNGKAVAEVANRGHGGCDEFHLLPGTVTRDEFIEQAMADMVGTGFVEHERAETAKFYAENNLGDPPADEKNPWSLFEAWCAREVGLHADRSDLKRRMGRKALYKMPGKDGIYQTSYKGNAKPDERLFAHVREKNPGAKVLNEMPIDEALELWRASA